MGTDFESWYSDFHNSEGVSNRTISSMESLVRSGKNSISFNRKIMKKTVDLSWVDAIEEALVHLDKVVRSPRVTIEEQEEIVPIALSKKITVESVKHLAQHTNLIQEFDEKTGKITPSKILNIYKEESYMTYENKFVNTLIDRLYIFVTRRYEKLKEVAKNEDAFSVDYSSMTNTNTGSRCRVSLKVEITSVPEDSSGGTYNTWERIEKIKLAAESYKGSKFCQKMGNAFIRPPVMRTNAIMKNVDLKACLVLWQFIVGYDKVGYDIYIADSAQNPSQEFIDDLGRMAVMNYMLLGYHIGMEDAADVRGSKTRSYAPKVLRQYNIEDPKEYDIVVSESKDQAHGYKLSRQLPDDAAAIAAEIDKIIGIEKQYLVDEENKIIEEKRAAEEAERRRIEEEQRRLEEQRLAAERKREQERLEAERLRREEEERKLREIMEQKKREEEERKFQEQEEAKRRERERAEAEARAKEEEERRQQEELERQEKAKKAAEDLANGITPEPEEEPEESKDSEELRKKKEAETAARLERERISAERAQRLRTERKLIESKPFQVIYEEYSRKPYYVLKRAIKKLLKLMGRKPDVERMTEDERQILLIEQRLEQYTAAEKAAKKQERLRKKLAKKGIILGENDQPETEQTETPENEITEPETELPETELPETELNEPEVPVSEETEVTENAPPEESPPEPDQQDSEQ